MKIEARRGENLQTEWIQASVCAGVRVWVCGCVSTGDMLHSRQLATKVVIVAILVVVAVAAAFVCCHSSQHFA